jgi:hypothetical protein
LQDQERLERAAAVAAEKPGRRDAAEPDDGAGTDLMPLRPKSFGKMLKLHLKNTDKHLRLTMTIDSNIGFNGIKNKKVHYVNIGMLSQNYTSLLFNYGRN